MDAGELEILRDEVRRARRSARSRLSLAVACAILLAAAASARAPADRPWRGRPLAEALLALRESGLTLVFTDAVVAPGLTVAEEPAASAPREILDEILAPHGLAAHEGPGGVLVVVALRVAETAAATLAGEVVRRGGAPIAGARVIVEEAGLEASTDAAGRFSIPGLAGRELTLRIEADGYLEGRVEGVAAAAEREGGLRIELDPSPFVLDEIVVRPSRLSLLHARPESPLALSRDEIAALPHLGDDLFRAISLLPGAAANDVTAQFSVHGGRRDEVEIRLDGQELYDAFHLAEHDHATSVVPARSLAGASLSTGAFAADRGDRMSGVLELTTLDAPRDRRFAVGLGVLDLSFAGGGRLPRERGGWAVHLRRGSLDLAADAIGDVGPEYWDLFAKLELEGERAVQSLRLLATDDDYELLEREAEDFERISTAYEKQYLWFVDRRSAGERFLVESFASWARIRRDRNGLASEEKGEFALEDRRETEVFELSQSFDLERSASRLLRFGWLGRRYDTRFDYRLEREPALAIEAPFAPPRADSIRFRGPLGGEHWGAWASERRTFGGRLTAEAGLRFDRHAATDDELWSPRLSLAWRLGERGVARAGWGRYFQSQRPYELGVEDGLDRLAPAERSEHAVLGLEALVRRTRPGLEAVRFEVYRRAVSDPRRRGENLLEPTNPFQETEPDRVVLVPESGEAEGVELLLRGAGPEWLRWWLAYSWSRSRERFGGVLGEVPRALDQRHAVGLDLNLDLPAGWDLNLAWRYRTGWPTTPVERFVREPDEPEEPEGPGEDEEPDGDDGLAAAEPEVALRFGPLRSQRFPDYHRLDLRASRRWLSRRGSFTLYFDVQNLLDRRNLAGYGLTLDDDEQPALEAEYWPEIVPSAGLVWEF